MNHNHKIFPWKPPNLHILEGLFSRSKPDTISKTLPAPTQPPLYSRKSDDRHWYRNILLRKDEGRLRNYPGLAPALPAPAPRGPRVLLTASFVLLIITDRGAPTLPPSQAKQSLPATASSSGAKNGSSDLRFFAANSHAGRVVPDL